MKPINIASADTTANTVTFTDGRTFPAHPIAVQRAFYGLFRTNDVFAFIDGDRAVSVSVWS